jgi:myo-inositol-1(or 4)-monophosphatase
MHVAASSALITLMIKATQQAARGLIRDFGEVEHLQVSRKGPGDFVSRADTKAEKTLIQELKRARPDYHILSEESGSIEGSDSTSYRWIIDPLDGTTNFLHGIPFFCIALALEKTSSQGKEIVAAVVNAPVLGEIFWAEKGAGAWSEKLHQGGMGAQRLRVSKRAELDDALILLSTLSGPNVDLYTHVRRTSSAVSLRNLGSSVLALAYLAAGRCDAYYTTLCSDAPTSNLQHEHPWDIAAGWLLVQEAGGVLQNISPGQENAGHYAERIVASNGLLQEACLQLIRP